MPKCDLSGKAAVIKNLVSHSNIKTKSKAALNVQNKKLFSTALKTFVRLKVATSVMRTIEKMGGLDTFVMRQSENLLSKKARAIKKRIKKVLQV